MVAYLNRNTGNYSANQEIHFHVINEAGYFHFPIIDDKLEVIIGNEKVNVPIRNIQGAFAEDKEDTAFLEYLKNFIKRHKKAIFFDTHIHEWNYFLMDEENIVNDVFKSFLDPTIFAMDEAESRILISDMVMNIAIEEGLDVYIVGSAEVDEFFILKYNNDTWEEIDGLEKYFESPFDAANAVI